MPRVPLKKLQLFQIFRRISCSLGLKCSHFFVMTLFRSAFLYLASKILRILHVELIVLSYLRHFLTYELIKESSHLTIFYVKDLNS